MRTLRITNGGPERAEKKEFGGGRKIVQTQNYPKQGSVFAVRGFPLIRLTLSQSYDAYNYISLPLIPKQGGSFHKRQKPQAPTPQVPIRNRQTRKVANAKSLNRNTNLT